MTGNKHRKKERLVKVARADREWISREAATLILKRDKDGSVPIPWEQVKKELREMDRLGL